MKYRLEDVDGNYLGTFTADSPDDALEAYGALVGSLGQGGYTISDWARRLKITEEELRKELKSFRIWQEVVWENE